jgi:hypothetical protein
VAAARRFKAYDTRRLERPLAANSLLQLRGEGRTPGGLPASKQAMPVCQPYRWSRASCSSQAVRKRTKRSAGLGRVVCRRHWKYRLDWRANRVRAAWRSPKASTSCKGIDADSSATARGCPTPASWTTNSIAAPYLEIRRGERTTLTRGQLSNTFRL